ncbi:MAG: hypothetical protein V3S47_01630 [Acidobacteriota bacterium]
MSNLIGPRGLRRYTLPWLLLDAALPSSCFACGKRLGSRQALGACHRCWLGLDPAPEMARTSPDGATVVSAVRYTGLARRYLLRAKFGRRRELFDPMGRMLLAVFRQQPFRPGCIVPVPSHPWDTWTRGFTPSLEIARPLARAAGIPIRPLLHRRWRPWTPIKRLDRAGREALAATVFGVSCDLDGASVLLIDDLVTTGSTLAACSRRCIEAGASEVHGLVWARAAPFL